MNFKKILASLAAAAVAVSAMAVSVFAEEAVAFSGKGSVQSTGNWWDEYKPTVAELIGDTDPATVTKVVVTSDQLAYAGYNCTTTGDYAKVELPAGKAVELADVLFTEDYMMSFCVSSDKTDYVANVTWDVYADPDKAAVEEEAPAEEEATEEAVEEEAAEEEAVEEEATEEEAVEEEAAEEVADPNALPFTLGQYTYDFVFNGTDYENTKTITFTFETADDEDFGGGVMFNGTACGWSQSEDNFFSGPEGDKDLKCVKIDDCKYELTVAIPEGIFGTYTDEDFYAQVVVQKWWGSDPVSIVAVELDKEAAAEEAPATGDVDGATDSTKGSPDTGVADVAVVAGLALVAGGAFIVAKKRK